MYVSELHCLMNHELESPALIDSNSKIFNAIFIGV